MAPAATITTTHPTLRATLRGVLREDQANGARVAQFRGIKYGRVPARFAPPAPTTPNGSLSGRGECGGSGGGGGGGGTEDVGREEVDCTQYGPRCPQQAFDVGYLLRLPEEVVLPHEPEDEFECLNLDVTMPAAALRRVEGRGEGGGGGGGGGGAKAEERLLPVMVWIHGGSQVMTFGSAASGICDPCRIVADSITQSMPIIVVAMQYRLNIFAFGDGKGSRNLALKDQRLAIEWVKEHIAGFGGDPANVTVAGESAGAVYAHAHVVQGAPIKRAILMSGTLEMSPPRPLSYEATITAPIEARLASIDVNIVSMWLQQSPDEPELSEWTRTGSAKSLLIGDVEYESILWRNGIEALDAQTIVDAFDLAGEHSSELRRAYGIMGSRATQTKTGALDFINDTRFSWPIRKLSRAWRAGGRAVYGYVVDQANPWQASSRAHHAVDLVLLFGGLDLASNPAAAAAANEMRRRWIAFVDGAAPWSANTTFAFGPHGDCRELDAGGLAGRRRTAQMATLERVERGQVDAVFAALAAGRVSILN